MHLQTMVSWSAQIKLPYSVLENLPEGTDCPNVIGGCGNKQGKNKTRQLYKSNFPTNVWEAITGYWLLPGPKLKHRRCSSATGKEEKRKSTNERGEFKTHSWRAQTAHRVSLKVDIQLQRHLLLGRYLYWAQCPKSYFNHWKSCGCGQGSPVELLKHRHLAVPEMPQAHCLVPSSCPRWTCASCRSYHTFQD